MADCRLIPTGLFRPLPFALWGLTSLAVIKVADSICYPVVLPCCFPLTRMNASSRRTFDVKNLISWIFQDRLQHPDVCRFRHHVRLDYQLVKINVSV